MRWLVEVSSLGKTDLQKFCVEAESWQRALQAARSQRGEDGPMSGFSIELLEEGYRAVDPLARVRFVVKRAPDDMPVTAQTTAKDGKSIAPAATTSSAPPAAAAPAASVAPRAPSEPKISTAPVSSKSGPPRPVTSERPAPASNNTNSTASSKLAATSTPPEKKASEPASKAAAPPPVGSQLPGLPPVKLVASREQNATEASPLTYREYAFAVPSGTNDEVAADVLRGQLQLVEAHIAGAKMGRLVNLAVFDVEFKGKPPKAPLATLTWKDWKGDPVIAFPQRGPTSQPPRPPDAAPSVPPPSMLAAVANAAAVTSVAPAPVIAAPSAPPPVVVAAASVAPAPVVASSAPPPVAVAVSVAPAPVVASSAPPPGAAAVVPPAPQTEPVVAAAAAAAPATASQPPPPPANHEAARTSQAPRNSDAPRNGEARTSDVPRRPSSPSSPEGMVRTPSGRYVRGRVTGDELISSLFESMHDLHFLRDALDGGQFCLALATEVLPARAALIHFFDIERREWVVACTRGKDTPRLLNVRTPESDELLRSAARKRRAVVMVDATSVTSSQRYQAIGGSRSLIVAPIMQAGRALGAIEIINPLDGKPFTEDEGNAMTYIAEQYAEYLGSRGIVLDRERIQSAAAR